MSQGVGFKAHPEIRQVDAWFDAERGSWHDRAGIVGLEAVQIHAVGVGLGADAVPQSVYEPVGVAGGGDDTTGDSIDGSTGYGTAGAQLDLKEVDGGIAGVAGLSGRSSARGPREAGPMTATQVMSAYTASSGSRCLAHASMSNQSPRRMVADRSAVGS